MKQSFLKGISFKGVRLIFKETLSCRKPIRVVHENLILFHDTRRSLWLMNNQILNCKMTQSNALGKTFERSSSLVVIV